MERWVSKVALVTGASSGIGLGIAEKLVEQGLQVIGVARRKDRLDELAKKLANKKGKFYAVQGDVSKEEDILNAFKWTKENVGYVSVLVNNAGVSREALLSESDTQSWKDILDINVLATLIASREAIKHMKESNTDGQIININSIFGHKLVKFPSSNLYMPSKHAVTALTENLRLELGSLGSKIKVTSLSPGLVDTEIIDPTFNTRMSERTVNIIKTMPKLQPEDIGNGVVYVLSTPQHVNVSELTLQPLGEMF